jgi:hypothetical protein
MAKKINASSATLDIIGPAVVKNRRPMPPVAALYLAHLRAHSLTVPPRRQEQQIAISVEDTPEKPSPVKIIQTG